MVEIKIRIKQQPESENAYDAAAALLGWIFKKTGIEADVSVETSVNRKLSAPTFMSKREV